MEPSDYYLFPSSDDSGIVLTPSTDLDNWIQLLNGNLLGENSIANNPSPFYEIQSKPVKESPPTSLKNTTMTSRTNMRQQLMREQAYREEQRMRQEEMEAQQQIAAQSLPSQPLAINTPIMPSAEMEVPAQVLQVKSRLNNPTQSYVNQCKVRQVKKYLNESKVIDEQVPTTAYSLLSSNGRRNRSATTSGGRPPENAASVPVPLTCFSAPDSPQSVAPGSSVATSVSDVDFDVLTLENGAIELMDGQFGFANTLPNVGVPDLFSIQDSKLGKISSSCPAVTEESQITVLSASDIKAFTKDRQKKDNHNMIERRRRCKINDQIKELGRLLPNSGEAYFDIVRDVRRHKGTILTASVNLIKRMKNDVGRMQHMEDRIRQLEQNNRKQLLRIQELETSAQTHGIPLSDTTWQTASMDDIMHLIKREPTFVKCESLDNNDNHIGNDMTALTHNQMLDEEDYCAIISDPMLSSPPEGSTSSNLDDALSPESMDFMA